MQSICIRSYRTEDCAQMAQLFYHTVHSVNRFDYTAAQCDAWADGAVDLAAWDRSFRSNFTFVAECEGILVGFGDIDQTGYLDRLYVHFAHQRSGIGTKLCDKLEDCVETKIITVHASITAQPFFLARGYQMMREQWVERHGILLKNTVMQLLR